ncbi:MAG TPA: response regulator [Verrucomicrobiae bacterium]
MPLPLQKRRILIADDEEMVRLILRTILSHAGFEVVEAANGEEAIAQHSMARQSFSVVVMDMQMPTLNGMEAMKRILSKDATVQGILLSGGLSNLQEAAPPEFERVRFLHKPFDNHELVQTVVQLIYITEGLEIPAKRRPVSGKVQFKSTSRVPPPG